MKLELQDKKAVKSCAAGLFLMPLRWVCAWVLFSAAWRRLVLNPESLDVHSAIFEGLKLNRFLPNALWVHGFLKYLLLHPSTLLAFLWAFTLLEASLGILLLLGLGSRLLGIILVFFFIHLMLGAGWLGGTCLDEWTLNAFGMGIGICLFLAGSGPYSLDAVISKKTSILTRHRYWKFFLSPELLFIQNYQKVRYGTLILSFLLLGFVLYTNQHFVGGVYGPFHNPALTVDLKSSAELLENGDLALTIYRNDGPETYGAFIIKVTVENAAGAVLENYEANILGNLTPSAIHNYLLAKAWSNGNALLLPLGSLATVSLFPEKSLQLTPGKYFVTITDISGKTWKTAVMIGGVKIKFDPNDLMNKTKK